MEDDQWQEGRRNEGDGPADKGNDTSMLWGIQMGHGGGGI
jgi:hypothetical protein